MPAYILDSVSYQKNPLKEPNSTEFEQSRENALNERPGSCDTILNDSLHERVEWSGPPSGEALAGSYIDRIWILETIGKLDTIKGLGLEKYMNVAGEIKKGGKEKFLEYNLMFASMAAYYSDKTTAIYAEKYIKNGVYSQKEYDKVKDFAGELQDKAGVFISIVFYDDEAHGKQVSSTYMGALCCIGVEKLSFMAAHREADGIWVNLAQGAYKNEGDLLQALRDGGYDGVAEEYLESYGESEEKIAERAFAEKDGSLWDMTIGGANMKVKWRNEEAFKNLKLKYFGTEDVHVTYDSLQLDEAYEAGKKELEKIIGCTRNAGSGNAEETDAEKIQKEIKALRKEMIGVNKQIREIKATALSDEKKNEMIGKFEQKLQTLQMRVNDLLNKLAEEAKEGKR